MKCVICKQGELKKGHATVTLEIKNTTLVFKSVPAQVCENCGEEFVDDNVTGKLLQQAANAAAEGVQLDVRIYIAA